MRIGFIAGIDEKDFAFAKEHGFPCVEFNSFPGGVEKYAAAVADVVKWKAKHGVALSSFGYFGAEYLSPDKELREKALAGARQSVEVCERLGAPVLVMGAGSTPTRAVEGGGKPQPVKVDEANRLAIEAVAPVVRQAEAAGLKVAFYNCGWSNFCFNESAWGAFLNAFPAAGIKFDPSHPFYRGENYLAQMRDWGHRFLHVHAKGSLSVAGTRFTDPPAGMDQTDWPSFFGILHAVGYRGDVNLEPHAAPWASGEMRYRGLVFSQRCLRQFLAEE
jgi:sugar phosphate isomerase/epimerase